jgi:hypothetical protein
MTRFVAKKSQLPLFVGALVLAAGCTFEPPGSVLNNTVGPRVDAGTVVPGDDGDVGGGDLESLTFTFTSQPVGIDPVYAPANIVATWIEDSLGAHVATIDRKSAVRTNSLVAWRAASGANNTDAVTGATRLDHAAPVTVQWMIPAAIPNGIYTIRVETCDTNAVAPADNTQGTFTFEKNGTASTQTPVGVLGYTNVTIDYSGTPVAP